MKIDLFTKGILTVIAVALVFIAIDTQPVKQAQASGGGDQVSPAQVSTFHVDGGPPWFFVTDGNRVKVCEYYQNGKGPCHQWQSIK